MPSHTAHAFPIHHSQWLVDHVGEIIHTQTNSTALPHPAAFAVLQSVCKALENMLYSPCHITSCHGGTQQPLCVVALKSIYPLSSLHCTKSSSCGCAERWWAILKVCRVGRLT